MSILILFCAIVIFSCMITNKFSNKLGVPALIFFMFMGILFGSDGILKISFDDYDITSKLCSIGLLFIIFYGGFCTKTPKSKKIIAQATLLSSLGTIFTTGFCALFCYYILKFSFAESFTIGAVISSTDAASVFSILRSKRLNLKYNTAPILEMESGSNDPFAYILTLLGIALLQGENIASLSELLIKQVFLGIFFGIAIAKIALIVFQKTKLLVQNNDVLFITAIALASFSIPDLLGGNGFLSVYLTGIILGNSKIKNKINLIHFFDGITALFQVLIFFLIGFLSFPHRIPEVLLSAILITLFLNFIARPLAIFLILKPFKSTLNQIFFISCAGLRGAASIVFAILVVAQDSSLAQDLFHIVFVIILLSITIQGTLLPYFAKISLMIDRYADVRKTFNDYQQELAITLNKLTLKETHPWVGHQLKDVVISDNALILAINRKNDKIIPNGQTEFKANDEVLIGTTYSQTGEDLNLCETNIDIEHEWLNKKIKEIDCPNDFLIALIKRNEDYFVPNGETKIRLNDTIIFYDN